MDQYLKNAWYMAAWAHEVGDAGLMREILGLPLFLYRLESGGVVALHDRCPHRFAPLSMGDREGDAVVCRYHGLKFGSDGACVRNPFADKIPAGANVRAFPAVEKDDIIWLWAGEGEGDRTLIPAFSFIPDTPATKTLTGYTLMQANYEYGTDNLMDLSHIEFVHRGSFAGQGVIFAGQHNVRQDGNTLHSDWWMENIAPPSVADGVFPPEMKVDHWLDMRWNAPASMRLLVGVCPTGAPKEAGFEVPQAHILTPANQHETHYFWSTTRGVEVDNVALDGVLLTLFRQAFDEEDKPIIEAAYANIRASLDNGADFWAQRPVSLGLDQGGTRARRLLEKMIKAEANG